LASAEHFAGIWDDMRRMNDGVRESEASGTGDGLAGVQLVPDCSARSAFDRQSLTPAIRPYPTLPAKATGKIPSGPTRADPAELKDLTKQRSMVRRREKRITRRLRSPTSRLP
jgi:hypothetical protein